MTGQSAYRPLTTDEIARLEAGGCEARDWGRVRVADPFDPSRVRSVRFAGDVEIAPAGAGEIDGRPTGLYDATIRDCRIGPGVRIARVRVVLDGYDIADGAAVEDVGLVRARPGATFGNGVEVAAVNEAGGREVILYDTLSSQVAHMLCLHRHRPAMIERLQTLARREAGKARADRGRIGPGSVVRSVGEMIDVRVGASARIIGASLLANGTILSTPEAPTEVGAGVTARDFIIAEGSRVTDSAMIDKTYVGQGCRIGKQYSAESSLFFANCEAFHGEACSIFAGPYTVTHHKGTLLIACMLSFYNAGSATNQSNHMYKLGPVHEGKLERGVKTGSFSYMMWPCRVGPFSVVLGKHTRNFDTSGYPFSHIEATAEGRCVMVPGFTLATVGTVRDGAKWPKRDRRSKGVDVGSGGGSGGGGGRDRIGFDVLSPLTVGRMIEASERLGELRARTDKAVEFVTIGGADVKRVMLRSGLKYYKSGIQSYLLEKAADRLESALDAGVASIADALKPAGMSIEGSDRGWVDVGGQMMPMSRLRALWEAIERGEVDSIDAIEARLDEIYSTYAEDEWAWVAWAYGRVFGTPLHELPTEDLARIGEELARVKGGFLRLVLIDAKKEYDGQSRIGFGCDGNEADRDEDFARVRGAYEDNSFVADLNAQIDRLTERAERLRAKVLGRQSNR